MWFNLHGFARSDGIIAHSHARIEMLGVKTEEALPLRAELMHEHLCLTRTPPSMCMCTYGLPNVPRFPFNYSRNIFYFFDFILFLNYFGNDSLRPSVCVCVIVRAHTPATFAGIVNVTLGFIGTLTTVGKLNGPVDHTLPSPWQPSGLDHARAQPHQPVIGCNGVHLRIQSSTLLFLSSRSPCAYTGDGFGREGSETVHRWFRRA